MRFCPMVVLLLHINSKHNQSFAHNRAWNCVLRTLLPLNWMIVQDLKINSRHLLRFSQLVAGLASEFSGLEFANCVEVPASTSVNDLSHRWPWESKLILFFQAEIKLLQMHCCQLFLSQTKSIKVTRTATVAYQYQCKNVIFVQHWHILVCETWYKCKNYL